jgi:Icc-related predicted phosphoesterase
LRIVCTSDFHGMYPPPETMPEGDVLVFAGDIDLRLGMTRNRDSVAAATAPFARWLREVAPKYGAIIGIGGNHDSLLEELPDVGYTLPWMYLCDSGVEHEGVKYWGAPWSNKFFDWSFMATDEVLANRWAMIPDDTDVLITHGPALGINDLAQGRTNVGSASLRRRLLEMRTKHGGPRLFVSGHIHEARGIEQWGMTTCINPSYVDGSYRPGYDPVVHELDWAKKPRNRAG